MTRETSVITTSRPRPRSLAEAGPIRATLNEVVTELERQAAADWDTHRKTARLVEVARRAFLDAPKGDASAEAHDAMMAAEGAERDTLKVAQAADEAVNAVRHAALCVERRQDAAHTAAVLARHCGHMEVAA